MSIVALLRHGISDPSDPISYAKHFLRIYQLIDVVLAAIPEHLRLPRPPILSAPEPDAIRAARIIADTLDIKRGEPETNRYEQCDALSEKIDHRTIVKFINRCVNSARPIIAVSHGLTINSIVATLIATYNRSYHKDWSGNTIPKEHHGIIVNPEAMAITLVKAPPIQTSNT